MKKIIYSSGLGLVFLVANIVFFFNSCTKSDTSAATAPFVGKWNGYSCDAQLNQITISGASTNYTMNVGYSVGDDTCLQKVSVLATVSSIDVGDFSMSTQRFIDKCGTNYTISGGGTIIGDSIVITTYIQSSKTGSTACLFKGKKQ